MNRHTAVRPLQLMYPSMPLMQESYVDRILKAKVYDVAVETALEAAPRLSQRLNNHVWFKREDLQPVFSFKIRGAYNKIAQLSAISAQRGVICASAGNHAQGVALAARTRGIPAVIVMPLTTPEIKVQAVAALGGEIILHGDDYDHAYEHATELGRREIWYSCIHSMIRMSLPGRARLPWKSCGSAMAMKSMPFSCPSAAAD